MAGIYIHIPFCKRVCSYCDFYKTTITSLIPDYLSALEKEMEFRTSYLKDAWIETIYIGGGTPSLLSAGQINRLLNKIKTRNHVNEDCEITIEANPDDLTPLYLQQLKDTPVNRLSIGVQSFDDRDLKLLNRRHTAAQAMECIVNARAAGFDNISIDLIYGIPGMDTNNWKKNLDVIPEVEHISAYHLTIEPGTALSRKASRGLLSLAAEEESAAQFTLLHRLAGRGFTHYEISNLAKDGFLSRHNSNYWMQKKYLGLGPSAHSYDLVSRQWNIRDLRNYITALQNGGNYFELETLSQNNRFNEYMMLSLRTMWGVDCTKLRNDFGEERYMQFVKDIQPFVNSEHVVVNGEQYIMTKRGWLISDYIMGNLIVAG